MDIIGILSGGFIINFIGACVRWIYGTVWRTIANRKKFKFSEYLNGPENSDDWFDRGHQLVNKVVGVIALVGVLMLIINK